MVDVVNGGIDMLSALADGIVWLLPTSPFTYLELAFDSKLLGYINYFLPVSEILGILTAWGAAVGGWYLYKIILRWFKLIR